MQCYLFETCFCLIFPALDQNSLQDSACAEGDGLREPLSSGLEAVSPVDQQVQTPPASVHHSPASDHGVDVSTEGEFSYCHISNINLTGFHV